LKVPGSLAGEQRAQFEETFLEEGRILHRLSKMHAGIAQALDVGAATSPSGVWTPYLVLEWLEGRSLQEELDERRARGSGMYTVAPRSRPLPHPMSPRAPRGSLRLPASSSSCPSQSWPSVPSSGSDSSARPTRPTRPPSLPLPRPPPLHRAQHPIPNLPCCALPPAPSRWAASRDR
jgi:hypothetical protein